MVAPLRCYRRGVDLSAANQVVKLLLPSPIFAAEGLGVRVFGTWTPNALTPRPLSRKAGRGAEESLDP